MSRKLRSEIGASIILALLLLMVVTLFCSSLFYIMSTTTKNAGQEKGREQSLILAQSFSKVVQKEMEDQESNLYTYLTENVAHGWGYYNSDEVFNSNKDLVTRTFKITDFASDYGLNADIQLSMYWCSDGDAEAKQDWTGGKRELHITVTVQVDGDDGPVASVNSVYDYSLKDQDSNEYYWAYRGSV